MAQLDAFILGAVFGFVLTAAWFSKQLYQLGGKKWKPTMQQQLRSLMKRNRK